MTYPNCEPFVPVFDLARTNGLGATVHAGETMQAAGVGHIENALNLLHPTRIGHGVAAQQSESLLKRLKYENITIECCLSSNRCMKVVNTYGEHPFFNTFKEHGIATTINTDDELLFNTSISQEYALMKTYGGLSPLEQLAVTERAVIASFIPEKYEHKCFAFSSKKTFRKASAGRAVRSSVCRRR